MSIILRLMWWLCLVAMPLQAQSSDPYKDRPDGHEKNKQSAVSAYAANLKKYRSDPNLLVLPGLVADRQRQRIEVMVESSKLAPNAPCEFTIVAEASEHAYEASLISFAQPSAIHRALEFIGKKPGEPMDPAVGRFWARGECFALSLLRENDPPIRLEKLFIDQRTGKTLTQQGFRFTGSRRLPAPNDPQKEVYAADELQPMSIVSLFTSPVSVLEVPYAAEQSEVYQNTVLNPEKALKVGSLLTLLIEPVNRADARPIKDLVLQVHTSQTASAITLSGLERLKKLTFQLKDSDAVLNDQPTISSVVAAIAGLDRAKIDYYLTISFGDDLELGSAQALAKILLIMDNERGIRINPPPAGQLFYRAFDPDRELLDRKTRLYQPWELSISEIDGRVSGKLLRIDSVWNNGDAKAELEFNESSVSSPRDLRKAFAAEAKRITKAKITARPPIIMVFAPATIKYGQLTKFLEPALSAHKSVYVYVDEPMPPIPEKKS